MQWQHADNMRATLLRMRTSVVGVSINRLQAGKGEGLVSKHGVLAVGKLAVGKTFMYLYFLVSRF